MSRSYRKTPISSNTASGFRNGEKKDKRIGQHKLRASIKRDIVNSNDVLSDMKEVYDIAWEGRKDGKRWFNPEKNPRSMGK